MGHFYFIIYNNFCDKIIRLPREQQEQLWPRVLYVDMSGRGRYVMPFPLYHRLGPDDTIFDISQRYLEVVRRMDVHLQQAPVLGYNALATIGTYVGMLLTALGCQITEAPSLVRHPEGWEGRMEQALSLSPEVQPAVEFLRDFAEWKADDRSRYANTFLTKILPFIADPTMRAMFGASEPGIFWDQVVKKRQTVLLDFSRELNPERRRFKLLWCFQSLCDFFKLRGAAGRNDPISFIIDELTQLLGFGTEEQAAMASDIEELISVVARNYGVYLTIAHQNLPQIGSERIQKALMTMATQIIGVQTDPISAQLLAQTFIRYDPYQVKRQEPVWMSNMVGPFVVDYRPIEFTPEEQTLLGSHLFMDLRKFEFLARVPQGEGEVGQSLRRVSTARLDAGLYPDSEWVSQARTLLMQRSARRVEEVDAEIAARCQVHVRRVRADNEDPGALPGMWGE